MAKAAAIVTAPTTIRTAILFSITTYDARSERNGSRPPRPGSRPTSSLGLMPARVHARRPRAPQPSMVKVRRTNLQVPSSLDKVSS